MMDRSGGTANDPALGAALETFISYVASGSYVLVNEVVQAHDRVMFSGNYECRDCPSASPRIKRMKEGTIAPSCTHVSHWRLVSLMA